MLGGVLNDEDITFAERLEQGGLAMDLRVVPGG